MNEIELLQEILKYVENLHAWIVVVWFYMGIACTGVCITMLIEIIKKHKKNKKGDTKKW